MGIFTLSFGVNSCYVIRDKGTILVDGGPPDKRDEFLRQTKNIPMEPQEIKLIVVTHGHPDHAGSTRAIKELTGAKIAMHQLDKEFLEKGESKKVEVKAAKGSSWGWFMAGLSRPFPISVIKRILE